MVWSCWFLISTGFTSQIVPFRSGSMWISKQKSRVLWNVILFFMPSFPSSPTNWGYPKTWSKLLLLKFFERKFSPPNKTTHRPLQHSQLLPSRHGLKCLFSPGPGPVAFFSWKQIPNEKLAIKPENKSLEPCNQSWKQPEKYLSFTDHFWNLICYVCLFWTDLSSETRHLVWPLSRQL